MVLEGIEKAERNVLPILNNLLENREMQLEDGRFLVAADRYDKLLQVNIGSKYGKCSKISNIFLFSNKMLVINLITNILLENRKILKILTTNILLENRKMFKILEHIPFQDWNSQNACQNSKQGRP